MDRNYVAQLMYDLAQKRIALSAKKSADYATDEDALSDFKRVHVICAQFGIDPRRSPADCALFLTVLKMDRYCNLRNKGAEPQNESTEDTILDWHNYIDLAYACDIEKE